MRIAIAGDVHGHLSLLYAILGRQRRETGREIDLILQVGDLGAFGAESALDRATRRRAEVDPEELGFREYEGEHPPKTLLDPRPPLVFIPGNHEDFELLSRRADANPFAPAYQVTDDGKILALRPGRILQVEHPAGTLRIAGVSGVAGLVPKQGRHPGMLLDDETALALGARGPGTVDIVLSHDRPASVTGNFRHDRGGSTAIQLMLEGLRPAIACYGHYDDARETALGPTRVFGLAGVGYKGRGTGTVNRRCILIAEWEGGLRSAEWLEPPWLPSVRPGDWRRWD